MVTFHLNYAIVIFLVGCAASFVGSITAGGTLWSIPVLIFLGFAPQVAIATVKFGVLGSTSAGLYSFHKHQKVDYKLGTYGAILAAVGSLLGAQIMVNIPEAVLNRLVGIFLLALLALLILSQAGLKAKKRRFTLLQKTFSYMTFFLVGIWAGLFGGAGVLLNYVLILIFGLTFLEAAGTRKIMSFIMSIAPLIIYQANHIINWPYAIIIIFGMALGSALGSRYGLKKGEHWVRMLFVVVTTLMAIRLLL